jgi:molecular chaperone DnaK
LAGIHHSPLLQEPVAASLAYGFENYREKAFWVVYDFGGGTFDAAVVTVRDGTLQVVGNLGDDDLGGQDIDWRIVNDIFLPMLVRQYSLPDFCRGNAKWYGAFANLKMKAEEAKIYLSRSPSYEVDCDVCRDESGEQAILECTLAQEQINRLVEPLTLRAIETVRRLLKECRLEPGAIEKMLLVGGPTLTPHMRAMLADRREGLGVALEFSVDPLTVVARGGAIFAAGQARSASSAPSTTPGAFRIELVYKPMSADQEPLVGGKVVRPAGGGVKGYTVEFENAEAKPPWRSGRLTLAADGSFVTTLWADSTHRNRFDIRLRDLSGRACAVEPDHIDYTVSLEPANAVLPHNVGVAMKNNEVDVFFRKGAPLPIKKRHRHTTTRALVAGSPILIPIVEGNQPHDATLNRDIGYILISREQVRRDLRQGADVEITLQLDESRLLSGFVYIPELDQEFPLSFEGTLERPIPDPARLAEDVQRQKKRISALEDQVATAGGQAARRQLQEVTRAGWMHEIDQLSAAARDPDAALTCQNRLLEMKVRLAEIERAIEVPALKVEARNEIKWAEEVVKAHGSVEDQEYWARLKPELEAAIDGPVEDLPRKIREVYDLRWRLCWDQPWWWIGVRDYLETRRPEMIDQDVANKWFTHAERATASNDLEALRSACRQLWTLLPVEEQERGYGGLTMLAKETGASSGST